MNVLYYRKKRQMTQKELAQACGVSQSYIHALERGKRENPSIKVVLDMANALNVAPAKLLSERKEVG